jgi:hypothetical protein
MIIKRIGEMPGWVGKRVELWLGRLPLQAADIELINKKGIRSAGDFWKELSADQTLIDHLGLPDEPAMARFASTMAEVADYQSRRLTRSRLKNHLADMVVLVAIGAVLYGVFRDRRPKLQPAPHVTVSNPDGLMPFRVISASDLWIDTGAKNASGAMSINDFVGRYPTSYIAAGTTIDRSKLSLGRKLTTEETAMVFRVKVQPTSIMKGLEPPFTISLLACSRPKGQESCALVPDIKVLEFLAQADGLSIMIACKREDGARLGSLLGSSDLMATGPAR